VMFQLCSSIAVCCWCTACISVVNTYLVKVGAH
jgi:hypothetical protein